MSSQKRQQILEQKKAEELEAMKHRPGRPRKRKKPKKTFKDRRKHKPFYTTRVGYFLQSEAPLEYQLIVDASGNQDPLPDLIEQIGYGSLNPLFKKPKFRRALIEYRKWGCYSYRVIVCTPEMEMKHIKKRKKMLC